MDSLVSVANQASLTGILVAKFQQKEGDWMYSYLGTSLSWIP